MRNWEKNRSYCNRNCKLTNAITAIATLFSCSWYQLNPLSFFLYTFRGTLMETITTSDKQTSPHRLLISIFLSNSPPPHNTYPHKNGGFLMFSGCKEVVKIGLKLRDFRKKGLKELQIIWIFWINSMKIYQKFLSVHTNGKCHSTLLFPNKLKK